MYEPIDINALDFKEWVDEARAKVPFANQLSQLNQLDSHDTACFLTLLNGDKEKCALHWVYSSLMLALHAFIMVVKLVWKADKTLIIFGAFLGS